MEDMIETGHRDAADHEEQEKKDGKKSSRYGFGRFGFWQLR